MSMVNQIRFKGKDAVNWECLVIARVDGKVRIRTYAIRKRYLRGQMSYTLLVIERARVVERGFTWDVDQAWQWLEERTGGVSVD